LLQEYRQNYYLVNKKRQLYKLKVQSIAVPTHNAIYFCS